GAQGARIALRIEVPRFGPVHQRPADEAQRLHAVLGVGPGADVEEGRGTGRGASGTQELPPGKSAREIDGWARRSLSHVGRSKLHGDASGTGNRMPVASPPDRSPTPTVKNVFKARLE